MCLNNTGNRFANITNIAAFLNYPLLFTIDRFNFSENFRIKI